MFRDKLRQLFTSPALGDLWRWSVPVRLPLAVICLTNAVGALCSLGMTLCTKGLIDGATGGAGGQLRLYAAALVAVAALELANGYFHRVLKRRTSVKLLNHLRADALASVLEKEYAGLEGYHSGELVSRLQGDEGTVCAGIIGVVPKLVSMAVGFFGAAAILIAMDWRFAFVLVAGGILGTCLLSVLRKPLKRRQRAVRKIEDRLQSVLQETLQNLRLVKASGSESRMEEQLLSRQDQYAHAVMEQARFSARVHTGIVSVFQLTWLFCMIWGGWGILRGTLTYGSLAAIIRLVGEIQAPISDSAEVAAQALSTVTSAERLKELLDLPDEEPVSRTDGRTLYAALQEIRLRDVTFSYGREAANVLEGVNAVIRPGDFVALTGVSGGGKSTIFQLLLGIYKPTAGSVEFRFRDRTQAASRSTRRLFAYVPQGNTLFSGTLRENLTLFTEHAEEDEISWAVKAACIDELIEELDDGLDTVIGERGVGLSEGQAQRVAVARALLSRAPILLLDEATSALDEATEARLLSNLSAMKEQGRHSITCLIVTHRPAALSICDYRLHIQERNVGRMDTQEVSRALRSGTDDLPEPPDDLSDDLPEEAGMSIWDAE